MMKFRIGIGSPFPGDGETDIKTVTSLWHEACDYLAIEYKNGTSPFCIEICDLVSVLNVGATCMTDNAAFRKRYKKNETNGFWCYLDIIYRKKDFPGSRPPVEDISYFLQNLFLAMNLCMAGGCHLYRCTLPANPILEAWAPSLNGHPIESAWRAAARWGWPLLQTLSFEKVWQWLERVSLLDAVVAKSPAQTECFSEGIAAVSLGWKDHYGNYYGFIDKNNKVIIPAKYHKARKFSEGLAAVEEYGKGKKRWGKSGYIDKNDKWIIPPQYYMAGDFNEGVAQVYPEKEKCGFIDKKGRWVVPPFFERCGDFSEGLASVMIEGKFGYINKKGEVLITPKFNEARSFSGGLAQVDTPGDDDFTFKRGYINRSGSYVWGPRTYSSFP